MPIIKKWLYSEKEIFLRELVSNACDATTKLKRLASLGEYEANGETYRIDVAFSSTEKTITIKDNGIGMTEEELDRYICQMALSGAFEFVQKYEGKADESNECIQVTAGHTQNHTQGAAQECQSADHNESAQNETNHGGRTSLSTELLGSDAHDESAQNQAHDFGTEVLHNSSAVHADSASDITQEASDAETHVDGVAQSSQNDSCQTNQTAGQDDRPIDLFHSVDPHFYKICF